MSIPGDFERTPTARFLRDVLVCSLGAYGGPESHMSVFLDQLVVKRRYLSEEELIELFENFYRYGYLVFGGGQVVVPVMHTELVTVNAYMTDGEFLTGYGLVQGLPGPMFSFAPHAGG